MINTNKKFICSKDKVRLDKFLVEKLADLSRSKIQRLVVDGKVKVNSTSVKKKHHWLSAGDKIEVLKPYLVSKHPPLVKGKELAELKKTIKIIAETDNYLVLEKPAGLIVHPAENVQEYTLVNYLIKKYPQIKTVGDNPEFRPGIVHRLDKKVSGLMIVALNQKAFIHLKSQFKNRSIVKKYLALVHGQMNTNEGEVDFPIARSRRSGKMVAKAGNLDAKEALTLWEVKQAFRHYVLLDIQIKTGRTHQIRAHMKALNHPVVGDDLYNIKGQKDKFNLDRIFLHAYHLEFVDLNGKKQILEIELPEDLKAIIKEL